MSLTPKLINCHLHDEMSLLDGVGTAEQYCQRAVELGQKAIAITNHGNINSYIRWQKASEKYNIKVLFGCELYLTKNIEEKTKENKPGHACVWVKNEIGYRNLLKILTFANLYGFYRRPRCSFDYLLEHFEGLIIGTACHNSFINIDGGLDFLKKIVENFPEDIFLEIMLHDIDVQKTHNAKILSLHEQYGAPLLLTHDTHYVDAQSVKSQEVLLCMQSGNKMSNPDRWKFDIDDLYLCDANYLLSKAEKQDIISREKCIEAIKNTNKLAKKCDFKLKKQEMSLPIPPQFEGMDEEAVFKELCINGLTDRFKGDKIPENYLERLQTEYEVIKSKGFIRYFLIVYDIVKWCSENDIMVGPRGSAAGCLISYALGIVNIDPVANSLIFERFLNPERNSPPDIDLDLDKNKRNLVIERLKTLYGSDRVCNVSTFLKMEARTIIRDVARAYEVPLDEVDRFAKTIDSTIESAIEESEIGKSFYAKYQEVVDVAKTLQGQCKSLGKHAGGIVISPVPFDEGRAHLIERDGATLVNWDKDDAEYAGLIKFDFLGLATNSVISECLRLIKENEGVNVDLYKINLNDKKVYDELNAGRTVGFFQANTHTLRRLIVDMGVSNINQLSDALAGCRPGPLETTIPEYIKNKKTKTVPRINDVFDEITKDTYGVCIYQEQIMFILNRIAGFSMGKCDEVRRAIGKKRDIAYFTPFREDFVKGCEKVGLFSKEQADKWFDALLHYSRYGFNRSHSLSYAYVCYFTGWLKLHYSVYYLTANLTYGNEDKKNLLQEAMRLGLKIIPPKLNSSDGEKWIAKDGNLHVPFKEVKGLGPKTIETIKQFQQPDGFFATEKPILKGKLKTILEGIGAFGDEIPDNIDDFFDLGISLNPVKKYKKLYALVGEDTKWNIDALLTGNFIGGHFGREIEPLKPSGLMSCTACNLRKSGSHPVPVKGGRYNIAIVCEKPGWQDTKFGWLGGKNDAILWQELRKYGFEKDDFLLTGAVSCECKKPGKKEIEICSEKNLTNSLENIRFVLAFGNASINLFLGEESGIMRRNGETHWSEKYGAWVTFCVPPGLVEFKPEEFRGKFKEGIKNFVTTLENIGGFA